ASPADARRRHRCRGVPIVRWRRFRHRPATAGERRLCLELTAEFRRRTNMTASPAPAKSSGANSLEAQIKSRVARHETRRYDWDALKFQADFDPKYGRAQMRYVGTGGTGVSADTNVVPSEHFTFSTMLIPAGHEGP